MNNENCGVKHPDVSPGISLFLLFPRQRKSDYQKIQCPHVSLVLSGLSSFEFCVEETTTPYLPRLSLDIQAVTILLESSPINLNLMRLSHLR